MILAIFKRAVLAMALLFAGLVPAVAENNSMYWPMRSDHPFRVQVVFYSEWRNWEWPGAGQAYNLDDNQVHGFNLSCTPGEKICFGAWETGTSAVFWGVGHQRKRSCTACCYFCGDGQIPLQILDPVDF